MLRKIRLPVRQGEAEQPEPFGCAFDAEGRLFVTEVGSQVPGAANGQLLVFFPPDYRDGCLLDGRIGVAGTVAVGRDGAVYVAAFARVLRYAPPFPAAPGQCREIVPEPFIRFTGITAPLGIAQRPNGNWLVSIVFSAPTIREYTESGEFVRELFPAGTAGNPAGLAIDGRGAVYYADLGLSDEPLPRPVAGKGTLRRVSFDAEDRPRFPEVLDRGLDFPDAVSVLPQRPPEWLTYGANPRRTFFNPLEHRITAVSAPRLVPSWRYWTGGIVTAQPALARIDLPGQGPTDLVFAPSWDGNLYALRARNGSRVWSFAMKPQPGASFPYASSPAVAWIDGRPLVFVGGGMTMYAVDAANGEEVWHFDAGTGCETCDGVVAARERNEVESSPLVVGNRVYFGMDVDDGGRAKGGFFAVDARTGVLVWYFDVETGAVCRPLPGDEVRRFDGYHGAAELGLPEDFFATRPGCDFDRTGTTCGNIWSSASFDARRNMLFVATSNCDTDTDPATPEPPPPMPRFDESILALTTGGEPVWSWRPREVDNGDLAFGAAPNLFEVPVEEGGGEGGPRVLEVVGVGNKDGTYYVFTRDGVHPGGGRVEPYWRTRVVAGGSLGGILASAAVGEGRVFFGTAPGESVFEPQLPAAWALDAATGAVVWSNERKAPGFSPTSGVPGVVFMGEAVSAHSVALSAADGEILARLDTLGQPGGAASAPAIAGGRLYVGGGIGARGGRPADDPAFESSIVPSPISAFCVEGDPDCLPPCPDEDPPNPCTYNFRTEAGCASEPAPETIPCTVAGGLAGFCRRGQCAVLLPNR